MKKTGIIKIEMRNRNEIRVEKYFRSITKENRRYWEVSLT